MPTLGPFQPLPQFDDDLLHALAALGLRQALPERLDPLVLLAVASVADLRFAMPTHPFPVHQSPGFNPAKLIRPSRLLGMHAMWHRHRRRNRRPGWMTEGERVVARAGSLALVAHSTSAIARVLIIPVKQQ